MLGVEAIGEKEKSKIISVINPEETSRLLSVAPSVICLSGHYSNWEILFGFEHAQLPKGREQSYALRRDNAALVYKRLQNPLWDEIFREARLSLLGKDFPNYIESANILRHVVEHKNDGYFYLFETDQRPYANAKAVMDVQFMGRPAQTMYAGAGVAHKYGLAVTYLSMRRNSSRTGYECEFKTICDDASKMEIQEIMNEFYRHLSHRVLRDGDLLFARTGHLRVAGSLGADADAHSRERHGHRALHEPADGLGPRLVVPPLGQQLGLVFDVLLLCGEWRPVFPDCLPHSRNQGQVAR